MRDRGRAAWIGLAVGLPLVDVALLPAWPLAGLFGAAAAAVALRVARGRLLRLLILVPLLLDLTARAHMAIVAGSRLGSPPVRQEDVVRELQARLDRLVSRLSEAAREVAADPALTQGAPQALFDVLEAHQRRLAPELGSDVTLAIYERDNIDPLAWTDRAVDVPATMPAADSVFLVSRDTVARLVARAPLGERWVVTAVPMATPGLVARARDRLLDGWETAEIALRYLDVDQPHRQPDPDEHVLTDPEGNPLAAATVLRAPRARSLRLWDRYRFWAAAAIVAIGLLLLAAGPPWPTVPLVAIASGTRFALWLLALPLATPGVRPFAELDPGDLLGPFAGTAGQIAATAAWATIAALALARGLSAPKVPAPGSPGHASGAEAARADAAPPSTTQRRERALRRGGMAAALVADAASLALVAAGRSLVLAVLQRIPLDAEAAGETMTAHTILAHVTLLLVAGACIAVARLPQLAAVSGRSRLVLRGTLSALVLAAGLWALDAWSLATFVVILAPTIALQLASGAPAPITGWRLTVGPVIVVAALAAWLHPLAVSRAESTLRATIVRTYAPMVRDQPRWSVEVLRRSTAQVDRALRSNGADTLRSADERAYRLWKNTDLARFRFSSAIEMRDHEGHVTSRFASHLPATVVDTPLVSPRAPRWRIVTEPQPGLGGDRVLRARRRLAGGESIEVSVLLDHRNLPFIQVEDESLDRRESGDLPRHRGVALVSYDERGTALFASTEHPPQLAAPLLDETRARPAGFWSRLSIEGTDQPCFVFRGAQRVHVLTYPREGLLRSLASWVDALGRAALLAIATVLLWIVARTTLRRPGLTWTSVMRAVRRRFSLRLFEAFVLVALLPVVVIQLVVRGLAVDRLDVEAQTQALDRAAVARKAIEDFARFRSGESPGREPVTDAVLVWIGQIVRNPVDVFVGSKLVASSQRELYASGFLTPRLNGPTYRAVALAGAPYAFSQEHPADLAYDVVAVPVRLSPTLTGTVSLPLASREREQRAVLADLDRTMRLALIAFAALAAILAVSLARTISGPVAALTRATQRLAQGDVGVRVQAGTQDELSELVGSFNQMAGDLERQRHALERTHREAAWAEMARQVAHEVKNPLTPIQLSAEHLRRVWNDPKLDLKDTIEVCTETILRQVRGLRAIVTEFSAFARPVQESPSPADVADLLRAAAQPYRSVLPPLVTLDVDAPPGLRVKADRRLLLRAIVNLVENAVQAVEGGGQVRVTAEADASGRVCRIRVSDTGPGIPAEVQPHLFEPFFSTKSSGSGLGLSLTRRIVEEHGGTVAIEGALGQGASVLVQLPLAHANEAEGVAEPDEPEQPKAAD